MLRRPSASIQALVASNFNDFWAWLAVSMNQYLLTHSGAPNSVDHATYSVNCVALARAIVNQDQLDRHSRLRVIVPVVTQTVAAGIGDSALAAEISSRSYFHTNGYFKVVLFEFPDGRKLRLNYWPDAQTTKREEHCHNHRWGYASTVLAGEFVHETFRRAQAGRLFDHYVYTPRGDRETFDLHLAQKAFLIQEMAAALLAGDRYAVEFDVIHRFYPKTRAACSLFLQQPAIRNATDVFVEGGVCLEPSQPSPCLTTEQLRTACDGILAIVADDCARA